MLEQKELKLTQKGYLPVKIVSELYFSNDIEEKYIEAFPQLLRELIPTLASQQQYAENCYAFRTFEHFRNPVQK